jgi:hypothetical protein
MKSKESKEKPVFFKEVKKVWEKVEKGGPYSASNTLMIDDKPYKAYLNDVNSKLIFILFLLYMFFIYLFTC